MENQTNTEIKNDSIELDREGLSHLYETRKWTMFFSILGFVFIGLMLLGSMVLMSVAAMGLLQGILIFVLIVIVIAIYFFPIFYLYMFSEYSKVALTKMDGLSLTKAFNYLRKHYKFMGILSIIVLSLYLFIFIFAVLAGSLSSLYY